MPSQTMPGLPDNDFQQSIKVSDSPPGARSPSLETQVNPAIKAIPGELFTAEISKSQRAGPGFLPNRPSENKSGFPSHHGHPSKAFLKEGLR